MAEEVSGTNDYVQLTFRAYKLDNKVGTPESRPPTPLLLLGLPLKTDPRSPGLLSSQCEPIPHPPCSSHQPQGPFLLYLQDLFSKSDPFMEIYKTNEDQSDQLVWRTEVGAWGYGDEGRESKVRKPRQELTSHLVPLQGGEEQPEPQLGAVPPVPAFPMQL